MLTTLGVGMQALCLFCLKRAQLKSSRTHALSLFAVAIFVASVLVFTTGVGTELGTAWTLTTISVAAYALILWPLIFAKDIGHERQKLRTRTPPPNTHNFNIRLAVRLVSAGPVYLICALALSLVIATQPWLKEEDSRLFIGGLLCPVFWAIGALHATTDAYLWRIVLIPTGLTLLAAVTVLLQ